MPAGSVWLERINVQNDVVQEEGVDCGIAADSGKPREGSRISRSAQNDRRARVEKSAPAGLFLYWIFNSIMKMCAKCCNDR